MCACRSLGRPAALNPGCSMLACKSTIPIPVGPAAPGLGQSTEKDDVVVHRTRTSETSSQSCQYWDRVSSSPTDSREKITQRKVAHANCHHCHPPPTLMTFLKRSHGHSTVVQYPFHAAHAGAPSDSLWTMDLMMIRKGKCFIRM